MGAQDVESGGQGVRTGSEIHLLVARAGHAPSLPEPTLSLSLLI